jgi:putative ABC transport system permease protein
MLYWKLAFRNLFRHKTRLTLNLILLVGAFTSIVIFKGFKTNVLNHMRDVIIDTQLGNIQVAKEQYWNNTPVDRATDKLIEDPKALIQRLAAIDGIDYISARISFYGLINTETKSIPARFIGFDPNLETKLQPRLLFPKGHPFSDRKQVIVSTGLEKILKLKPDENVTIVSPTLDGGLNAMDLTTAGIFGTGFTETDNGTVFLSLADAQKMLDSDRVENLMIVLKDRERSRAIQSQIQGMLENTGLRAKSWQDISEIYAQVEGFFNFQNTVIEVILLLLLLLSVSNTMSMTVFERLAEIGTLRALGDYESNIQTLFFIEAILLGALAIAMAIPFSYVVVQLINAAGVPVVLPLASQSMPLQIAMTASSYASAIAICFFSIVLASLWPSKKGAATPIVDALRAKT